MAEYEIKDGVAIIPEGTTEIKQSAFHGCKELTTIVIPASVIKLGDVHFVLRDVQTLPK